MEVQFAPDVQAKLEEIARETGRPTAELVQAAVAGYVGKLSDLHSALDSRYDDIHSGKVTLIPGDEVFVRLRDKSAARRAKLGS